MAYQRDPEKFRESMRRKKVTTTLSRLEFTKDMSDSSTKYEKLDLSGITHVKCRGKRPTIPSLMNEELAEETGIHIGDGCLRKRKRGTWNYYFGCHIDDDRQYVLDFVVPLYEKLYGIVPHKYEDRINGVIKLEVSSKLFGLFKHKVLGLPNGKKTGVEIPEIIMNSALPVKVACLRGIFDTDGCISAAYYGGKNGYPKIDISNRSKVLLSQVKTILKELHIPYAQGKNAIAINGYSTAIWFKLVGSHNPKHLDRYNRIPSRYKLGS